MDCRFCSLGWFSSNESPSYEFFSVNLEGGEAVRAARLENLPVEGQIKRIWGDEAKTAIMVSWAENGTRECAREVIEPNGSKSYGVFMLNSVHFKKGYTEQDFKDCTKNIKIAYEFYKQSGWYPWSAWKNKSYLKFLK